MKNPKYLSFIYQIMQEEWESGQHQKVLGRLEPDSYLTGVFVMHLVAGRRVEIAHEILRALDELNEQKPDSELPS